MRVTSTSSRRLPITELYAPYGYRPEQNNNLPTWALLPSLGIATKSGFVPDSDSEEDQLASDKGEDQDIRPEKPGTHSSQTSNSSPGSGRRQGQHQQQRITTYYDKLPPKQAISEASKKHSASDEAGGRSEPSSMRAPPTPPVVEDEKDRPSSGKHRELEVKAEENRDTERSYHLPLRRGNVLPIPRQSTAPYAPSDTASTSTSASATVFYGPRRLRERPPQAQPYWTPPHPTRQVPALPTRELPEDELEKLTQASVAASMVGPQYVKTAGAERMAEALRRNCRHLAASVAGSGSLDKQGPVLDHREVRAAKGSVKTAARSQRCGLIIESIFGPDEEAMGSASEA